MARHFTPRLFAFLKDLREHNDRAWFQANQARFEEDVREPALRFIEDVSGPLLKVSEHFTADARKVGGSLFRIQRDTRFSSDKSPYKTQVGIQFRHVATRADVHAPGYYLHLEPGNCFAGVGLWHPSTEHAYAIRHKIADEGAAWKRATRSARFTGAYGGLQGESLVRPPRGFDDGHPLIDDLKRKDFLATARLTQKQVTSDGFLEEYLAAVKTATPFMRFLCEAIGVGF
ncbi:MAG: DUF2461 domain-containing protein [Actinobacteria bacterium]|nr:DUF2461 domain-containing protein [Actinomycetota bacterium]